MHIATRPHPPWLAFLLLPLLHQALLRLTNLAALTPEGEAVVWLPNAVLLAALLHYQGRGGWAFAALAWVSEFIANLSTIDVRTSALLPFINLFEVSFTYLVMQRAGASPRLERIPDFGKFLLAGPLAGALLASLLAAAVLKTLPDNTTPYLTLARVWWFGDGLGLLLLTPLLLSLAPAATPADAPPIVFGRLDIAVLLPTVALAMAIFSRSSNAIGEAAISPMLLLPSVLFWAVRYGPRWTALGTMLTTLITARCLTAGHPLFGQVEVHLAIVRAQEFILILCTVGIGFAILLAELKSNKRNLENKVRIRTQELEAINNHLATLSATDGLTGIANRRRFDEVLASEWSRAARSGQALALVMLDVDHFKKYNDHYGHLAGDDCLRQIAQLLAGHLRRTGDLVARYGGEEFVLISSIGHSNPAADALQIANTVCEALQALALPHAKSPLGIVTASLGVAVRIPEAGEATSTLVQQADQALYQAKSQGRNQVVLHTK